MKHVKDIMPGVRSVGGNRSFIAITSLLMDATGDNTECSVNLCFAKLGPTIFEAWMGSIKTSNDRLPKPYSILCVIRGGDL